MTANCIAPAITETDLFREMTPEHIAAMKAKIPMGRALTIPEIAAMVAWIAGPECSFTTGFAFDLTGGRATYSRPGEKVFSPDPLIYFCEFGTRRAAAPDSQKVRVGLGEGILFPPQPDTHREKTMDDLKGKVALVTGASRGLGEGAARELAAAGASVMLVARDGAAGRRRGAGHRRKGGARIPPSMSRTMRRWSAWSPPPAPASAGSTSW